MGQRSVFISYSRTDESDVRPAVELLRAGGVKVFLDVRDIDYGERWQEVLHKALARCERVMVFWSRAAAASEWVQREWKIALQLGKKIVPTLLDLTPLPKELAEFQAISRIRPHVDERYAQRARMSPSPQYARSSNGLLWLAVVFVLFVVIAVNWTMTRSTDPDPAVVAPEPPWIDGLDTGLALAMGLVALLVMGCVWTLRRSRRRSPEATAFVEEVFAA